MDVNLASIPHGVVQGGGRRRTPSLAALPGSAHAPGVPGEPHALVQRLTSDLEAADPHTVATQLALATIPAPTGAESARAEAVTACLRSAGCEVSQDQAGNVITCLGPRSDAAPVVVCAHLDTVFGDQVPHVIARDGDRYVGPGIGDNARGLAGLVAMARWLRRQPQATARPVVLAATVGEEGEGNLAGARALFAGIGAGAHAAIALDGAGDSRIVTHAIGVHRLRVTFTGPGGHSWAASDVPNPLHAAAAFTTSVAALHRPRTPRTTLAVTTCRAGHAVNAIPHEAVLEVDLRSLDPAVLRGLVRDVEALARRAAHDEGERGAGPSLVVTIRETGARPAGMTDPAAPLLRHAIATTAAIGCTAEFAMASTDANIPLSLGIPALTLGAGGHGGDTHTPREWYDNRGGATGLARALATVLLAAAD